VKISTKLAVWTALMTTMASATFAQDASRCASRVTRDNVVGCVLAASLWVNAEERAVDAAKARRVAVSPLLPSNPVLSLAAARRSIPTESSFNWDARLSQEIEVAGQRAVRRDAAQAEIDAQTMRVSVSRREVAASAWNAFFEALSAREEQRLALSLAAATQTVAEVARARADSGLTSPVDADVADAYALRNFQAKLAADRHVATQDARLASALGIDAARSAVVIEGELVPIGGVAQAAASRLPKAVEQRPEILALDAERRAFELRASAFRRSAIPNPTVALFAENDGFNERVLGVGLSLPIPLPGNVGRSYLGETAEAEALAHKASIERERSARTIRLEISTALQTFDSRTAEVAAFTPERVNRAHASLRSLGEEVEAGRLSVRDAVVAQQAFIELLQAQVAARRAWCLASVDLARAAGVALESQSP
jgi:cobalt-zinc-cadmium efflux system outer membrane protein